MKQSKPLAVVTGASTGIGYELGKLCAENGYDLVIAADQAKIEEAAEDFRALGTEVTVIQPTSLKSKASTAFMPPQDRWAGRLKRCSPMRATASGKLFSIKTSMKCAT